MCIRDSSESASFADDLNLTAQFFRSPEETFLVSENLQLSTDKIVADAMSISEVLTIDIQTSLSDSMTMSDSGEISFPDYAIDYFDGSNGNYAESTQTF